MAEGELLPTMVEKDIRFDKSDKIGSGSFADCYLVRNNNFEDKRVVYKKFTNSLTSVQQHAREFFLLANASKDCVNIVRPLAVICAAEAGLLGFVMEYCCYGPINKFVQKCMHLHHVSHPEDNCCLIFHLLRQILSALSYLHQKSITHNDICNNNILITVSEDKLVAKLADFGFAKVLSSTYSKKSLEVNDRKVIFRKPPELFDSFVNNKPSASTDKYQFGVVIAEAFCLLHSDQNASDLFGGGAFDKESFKQSVLSNEHFEFFKKAVPAILPDNLSDVVLKSMAKLIDCDLSIRPELKDVLRQWDNFDCSAQVIRLSSSIISIADVVGIPSVASDAMNTRDSAIQSTQQTDSEQITYTNSGSLSVHIGTVLGDVHHHTHYHDHNS